MTTVFYVSETPFGTSIVKVHDGIVSFVPDDPANPDWIAHQEWLAEGNTPEPWPPAE